MSQQGMTLIESLIVVAIFGLLSVLGFSFTGGWVDSNRVLDGENLVFQAFSNAKAAALRNKSGVVGATPAAVVCMQSGQLSVRTATNSSTAASCASTEIVWQTRLHNRLSIVSNGAAFACACLNNAGRMTAQDCAACSTTTIFSLSSGDESATVTIN